MEECVGFFDRKETKTLSMCVLGLKQEKEGGKRKRERERDGERNDMDYEENNQ